MGKGCSKDDAVMSCEMVQKVSGCSKDYTVVMSYETVQKVLAYKQDLLCKKTEPGAFLKKALIDKDLSQITDETFFQYMLQTKKPQLYAAYQLKGDGMDWNNAELIILGDVNIAVPVKVYDNMERSSAGSNKIVVYPQPFDGELLYTPGCLLKGQSFIRGSEALPDYAEVVENGKINQISYNKLVARRLLPIFKYANDKSTESQKALINVPGIGCYNFAGCFLGKLADKLNIALKELLQTHYKVLSNIALVRFDPFNECRDLQGSEEKYGSIIYRVRLLLDNPGKTQLCHPTAYQEKNDDFSHCKLFKVVAWDHVSYPGNDFWVGSRTSDDGAAAAATNSMNAFATVKGHYDHRHRKFVMADGSDKWLKKAKELSVTTDNLIIVDSNGNCVEGSFKT